MTQVGLAPDALFMMAQAALAALQNYWPGTPVSPLPDRQFVSNGQVFWDGPQVAVTVDRVFGMEGDISVEQYIPYSPTSGIRGIALSTHVIRTVPDVDSGAGDELHLPSTALITASALELYSDAVVVWNCLRYAQQVGQLATCQGLAFQDWVPQGPQGGMVDSVTTVRMALL